MLKRTGGRPRSWGALTTTLLSIVVALILGAVVLAAAGFNPLLVYRMIVTGVFSKPKFIAWTLLKAQPILLTGLAVAFAFRTGLFNIGAEGQFIIGMTAAAIAGYLFRLPPVIHPIVCMMVGMTAAAIYGGFVGVLKARFGVHEVISSIMLNWIALYLHNEVVIMKTFSQEINKSYPIRPTASLLILEEWKKSDAGREWLAGIPWLKDVMGTPINWGLPLALAAVFAVWFILTKTRLGFELRAVGAGRGTAEHSGIPIGRCVTFAMAISGALAGAAGSMQVLGITAPARLTNLAAMEGYGFDGIAVALMGNTSPIGCLFSALFFAVLKYGGSKVNMEPAYAPPEVVQIMIGVIMLCVAAPRVFTMLRARIIRLREARGLREARDHRAEEGNHE